MKAWLQKIGFFRSSAHSLQKWEKIRAKGKTRFVVQTAFVWGLTVAGMTHAFNTIFLNDPNYLSLGRVIFTVLGGSVFGLMVWREGEKEYQKALREIRVKAVAANSSPSESQGLSKT